MISFSEWFINLANKNPDITKAFQKKTIESFLAGELPNHEKAMKICQIAGGNSPKLVNMYLEQLERIIRFYTSPRGTVEEHVIMFHPKAAPRPRFTKFGRAYNPKGYTDWKNDLASILGTLKPSDTPILDVEFHFVSQKATWGPHTIKPDGDNLLKALQDALQLAGFVSDDCKLWDVRVRKYYSFSSKIILRIIR